MITMKQREEAIARSKPLFARCGIAISDAEYADMEVADFGLSDRYHQGAQIITLINTARVGFKLICLLPGQTLPEHWHTVRPEDPFTDAKEETLRVLLGTMYLYVPGEDTIARGRVPQGSAAHYTCRSERVLDAAHRQETLPPGTKHWMQGGPEGTVVASVSTAATCAYDPFTDPNIVRTTVIKEEPTS